MKVRVFHRVDGGVTVRRVNKMLKAKFILEEKIIDEDVGGDQDTQFFDICNQLSTHTRPKLVGATYEDIEESDLPIYDSNTRNKWRKKIGGGVHIDHSVVTRVEKKQIVEDNLDNELAKPNPDMKKAMLLQRKLDKGAYI